MGKLIIITIVLVAIAILLLCVRIVLTKNGEFRSQHISQSKAMRERGISCATSTDRRDRSSANRKMNISEL